MCFLQHVVRLERLKRETQAQLKTRVEFVERSTVTMTTTWMRTLLSFWKDDNKDSLTSFFTTLFVTAVWTVILPVASPWQPHTASRSAAKLVSCAHGRGCRTIQTQQKLSPEAKGMDTHPNPQRSSMRRFIKMTKVATHCNSSHRTGRRSRTRRRTSSLRWCTCRCCTWTQQTCMAGGTLRAKIKIPSERLKQQTLFSLQSKVLVLDQQIPTSVLGHIDVLWELSRLCWFGEKSISEQQIMYRCPSIYASKL